MGMNAGMDGLIGQAAGASAIQVQSVLDFLVKGGPVMIPIGLCSLVALAVIVERTISLRRSRVLPPDLLPRLRGMLSNRREERGRALDLCTSRGSPLGAVLAAGVRRLGEPVEMVERSIASAGEAEIFRLRKYQRLLSVIASVSTLLGLLGTIFGMITAFQTVAMSAEALGKTELLAKGIYEAMITTAAGLIVAIPVTLAHHWQAARVDQLVREMDRAAAEFVEEFAGAAAGRGDEPADIPFQTAAAGV
jgi:biopolymer transport protein ExbB